VILHTDTTRPPSPPSVPQVESLKASRAEAKGNAYREYVLDKHLAFLADPTNIAFEELELPQIIQVRQQGRGGGEGEQAHRGGGCVWRGGDIGICPGKPGHNGRPYGASTMCSDSYCGPRAPQHVDEHSAQRVSLQRVLMIPSHTKLVALTPYPPLPLPPPVSLPPPPLRSALR